MKFVIVGKLTVVHRVKREIDGDSIEEVAEVAREDKGCGKEWSDEIISTKFNIEGAFKKEDEENFAHLFKKKDEIIESVNKIYGL